MWSRCGSATSVAYLRSLVPGPAAKAAEGARAVQRSCNATRGNAERRIYDLLYKPGSHEVLYHTLQNFCVHIDAKAAVNAFCSLARLDTQRWVHQAQPGQRPARGSDKVDTALAEGAEASLSRRIGILLKNREDLPPVYVSNLMWSLAKVAAREPFAHLAEPISKRVVAEVPKLSGRDLATSLWALAVLVADTPQRQNLDSSLPPFLLQRLGLLAQSKDLKGYDLTQSLWAAAKLANQQVPGMVNLVSQIIKGALGEASTFECHSISVSLWSIGLTEELHSMPEVRQFAHELAKAAALSMKTMNSQMLANSAWGAARVQVNDAGFYEAAARAGLELRRSKDVAVLDQHIYNLAWSFVKVEAFSGAPRDYLLKAAMDGRPGGRVERMTPYHLAGLAWVLSKGFTPDTLYENKGETLTAPQVVQSAVSNCMRCARLSSEKFRPKELSWCLWAGARCKLQDQVLEMLPTTMQKLVESKDDLENVHQNYSMVFWSMGATDIGQGQLPPTLLKSFTDATVTSLARKEAKQAPTMSQVTSMCNAVWACAKADVHAPELVNLAIQFISEATEALELRYYIMVAIARVTAVYPVTWQNAAFVLHVYEEALWRLPSASDPLAEMQTNAEHLAWLRLALVYLPQFHRHLAKRRKVSAFPLSLEKYRGRDFTQSLLQRDVEDVLKRLAVKHFWSESVVEGGLSLDILLPPPGILPLPR